MSINHEVKGTLAKLLATENLVIEHKKVSTASFDVINRVLVLPIWDRASSTVYDLLVGHEVGHALYTPADDWRQSVTEAIPPDYVNVVEDARVEKLMKRKYPGLGKTFYRGYQELNDDDFFSIAKEDLTTLSLIDRINLHFKVGPFALVPFADDEQQFVEMTAEAETFADVLEICAMLVKYLKEKHVEKIAESENDAQQQANNQGSGDQSDQQVSGTSEGSTQPNDSGVESEEESDQSTEEKKASGKQGGGPTDEEVSKTQRAFDQQAEELTNKYAQEVDYIELPELLINNIIVDNKILRTHINKCYDEYYSERIKHYGNPYENCDADYREYKKESVKEVNYLVKEFECKKSADAYARASTARTGVLDTKMLHTYKYNDDIFKKVSVIPDGKNHGLIFVLDWSGSMHEYLMDTVKQLMNLVWFCRKVQIPFEVYAFTYEWIPRMIDPELTETLPNCVVADRKIDIHNRFHLLNLLTSKTSPKEFENDCINLWRLAGNADRKTHYYIPTPMGLDLSGTPLNESIIALHEIIPMFKKQNHLQKVNVVILTDGEGNGLAYRVDVRRKYGRDVDYLGTNSIGPGTALRDRKTGNIYREFGRDYQDYPTTIFLENLKDNFPYVNIIGFRIMSGSDFSGLYRGINNMMRYGDYPELSNAMKKWRKDGSYEFNEIGYDALYGIASNKLNQESSFEVKENATAAQIGKAFRDMMKTKRTSKKILSSFATLVS